MIHAKILIHEIRMNISELKAYKFSFFIDILIFFAIYSFVILSESGYKLSVYYSNDVTSKELILLGYAMWILSISAINTICSEIRQENIKGTLEQKFMAVVPFQWLLMGKILSSSIIQIAEVSIILILSRIFFNFDLKINIAIILFIFISLVGMYGLSLVIGSIVINKKRIGQLNLIIQIALLFLSNVFTVSEISLISKLLPLSLGNHLIRMSYSGSPINFKDILLLISVCIIWVLVGSMLFDRAINKVKMSGSLNLY